MLLSLCKIENSEQNSVWFRTVTKMVTDDGCYRKQRVVFSPFLEFQKPQHSDDSPEERCHYSAALGRSVHLSGRAV